MQATESFKNSIIPSESTYILKAKGVEKRTGLVFLRWEEADKTTVVAPSGTARYLDLTQLVTSG